MAADLARSPGAASDPAEDAARPAAPRERLHVLDALRGFALLGVLLANLRFFSGWFFLTDPWRTRIAGPDWIWYDRAQLLLIDGKFYTVFSLLFGTGFALQLARAQGSDFVRRYARRLVGLGAIGLAHLLLIWGGDILTVYAACGFALLALRRASSRALLSIAALLVLLPVAIETGLWASGAGSPAEEVGERIEAAVPDAVDEGEIDLERRAEGVDGTQFGAGRYRLGLIETHELPRVLAVFVLGLWVGRRVAAGRIADDRRLLARTALIGLAIGVPGNVAYAALGGLAGDPSPRTIAVTAVYTTAVLPLGLAYAALFAWLWARGAGRVLGLLAPAGRTALSNYLLQSIVCALTFWRVGFDQAGSWPPWLWLSFGAFVFLAQVALSHLWLRTFRYGPVEWLWRCFTYRAWVPMRRSP